LGRAGAALRALHHVPQAVPARLTVADFASEIREVERDIRSRSRAAACRWAPAHRTILDRAQELHVATQQEVTQLSRIAISNANTCWPAPGGLTHTTSNRFRSGRPGVRVREVPRRPAVVVHRLRPGRTVRRRKRRSLAGVRSRRGGRHACSRPSLRGGRVVQMTVLTRATCSSGTRRAELSRLSDQGRGRV